MVSCGTSDVGEALYKGTSFGARNETGMDNSATHDEAVYDPATRTLSTFDLGLNCAVALDAEMLAKLATVLGKRQDAAQFEAIAMKLRGRIREELWDDQRKIFANRQRSGAFVKSLSPTSFYPLLCGAASDEQARYLIGHLKDERPICRRIRPSECDEKRSGFCRKRLLARPDLAERQLSRLARPEEIRP